MIAERYCHLPEKFICAGISLENIGIDEVAWGKEAALAVVDYLGEKGYTILGGDVYKYDDGKIIITYDSWYFEATHKKNSVTLSGLKAKEYIEEYNKVNGEEYIYSIIF